MLDPLHNSHGERLDHEFRPGRSGSRELVLIGHGVTANKDRPWLVALSDALSEIEIASLRISFSGNGESEGRFEESTISKEVEDLGCVLERLGEWDVTYVGHSMGGAVGVLRAARDERIQRLVSLAGMVHTRSFCERKFGELEPGRDVMWEKPECPLSAAFVDDLTSIDTVIEQVPAIRVPWLLVHGSEDTVVPFQDSVDAQAAARAPVELVELPGVDHVFSGDATGAMTRAVTDWLGR